MFLLTVRQKNTIDTFSIESGQVIYDILQKNNILLPAVCGGRGVCGKCAIRLLNGEIEISAEDKAFFSAAKLENGMRLACTAKLTGDAEISVETRGANEFQILNIYKQIDCIKPKLYKIIKISCASLLNDLEKDFRGNLSEYIRGNFSDTKIYIRLLKKLSGIINIDKINEGGLYGAKELYALVKGNGLLDIFSDKSTKVYGIAIDIGTTTLCFEMLDLIDGKHISSHTGINSQRRFGADVISRIAASGDNIAELQACIHKDILDGISALLSLCDGDARSIYKIEIAANTTMIHLLLGIQCHSLGVSPFNTTITEKCLFSFNDIFNSCLCDCDVEILPSISAYVGSDVCAGILLCGFNRIEKPSLIIDLGTNGEMALFDRSGILCTSTAAGPAFEGGNISCGTGGIPGAISSVSRDDAGFKCETIGAAAPIGICGSGVMDAVACLLESNLIDETGLLIDDFFEDGVELAPGIFLTQKDIRELQLAKSAVRAGIEVLFKVAGISHPGLELDAVYLAGSFGYHMDIRSAVTIGLIPPELGDKLVAVGNSSLGGCVKAMLEPHAIEELQDIASRAKEINLSESALFNNLFMEHMSF